MITWLKKTFIPHEGNDHHPHFWRNSSVALLLAIMVVTESGVFVQSFLLLNKDSYLAAVLPAVVASLTNDERTINNATPLKENSLLDEAARLKAEDMAAKGYFSHTTPEGYSSWYWLDRAGYQYSHAGENLAVNFTDSKDVVDAWMNSPTHRANIVKQIYTEIGIGMAEGQYEGKSVIFVVQFFGTPAIAASNIPETVVKEPQAVPVKVTTPTTIVAVTPNATSSGSSTEPVVASATTTQVAGAETNTTVITPGVLEKLAASPRHIGMYILLILLTLVVGAYIAYALTRKGFHHPRIIAASLALMLIIGGLLTLNTLVLKDPLVIGQADFISVNI